MKFGLSEKKAIRDVIDSGWVTTGPKVREFERKFAKFTGAKYATAVSSGTAGLHLSLKALRVGPGDEVVTTPMTMAATVEAILYCGAKPVFADIGPATLNIDPHEVEKRITGKTKAIITVDMAGMPCDYQDLKRVSRKYGIKLIEDAAHALGGEYRNKRIGTIADCTVFSFYPTKNITTGEGGMVTTGNKRISEKIRLLSLHGMGSSGWKRYEGGSWRYDITELGYKYNMAEIPAALGMVQLARFNEFHEKRKKLAERYGKGLVHLRDYLELPAVFSDRKPVRHLYIIQLNLRKWKIGRDRVIRELERRGVGCGVHFIPVYRFKYYRERLDYKPNNFPVTEASFKRIISLPFYVDLSLKEVDYVCKVLSELVRKYSK